MISLPRFAVHSLLLMSLLSATAVAYSQSVSAADRLNKPVEKATAKPASHAETPERVFQSQCSRCHSAPETLSPRITGTVTRHMRVRANLSAEQERMILSYFNP